MKKTLSVLSILITLLFLFSCQKGNNLDTLKGKNFSPEQFFEKVSAMNLKVSNENVIYIDFKWDKRNHTITYLSAQEKEPDFFILQMKESGFKVTSATYTVHCENKLKSWDDECGGKFSCGKLISKCLDEGGCATICEKQLAFAPQTNTFYLLSD